MHNIHAKLQVMQKDVVGVKKVEISYIYDDHVYDRYYNTYCQESICKLLAVLLVLYLILISLLI